MADWLRSLYPTETSARYWGPLQPDRLGSTSSERSARGNLTCSVISSAPRAAERFFGPGVDEQHSIRVGLARASVLNDLGSFDAALTLIDDVVGRVRRAVEDDRIQPDVLGRALDLQAAVLAETGRAEAAISYEYEASEILRGFAQRTGTAEARRDAAKIDSNLAGLLQGVGRVEEADKVAEEALSRLEELAVSGELALSDDTLGRALLNRARIAGVLAQPAAAMELGARAGAEFGRIATLGPAETVAMVPERAAAAEVQCIAAVELGEIDDALPAAVRAVELLAQVAERVPAFVVDLARANVQLAQVRVARGEGPRALEVAQRAVWLLREHAPAEQDEPSARRRRTLLESKAHETQRRAEDLVWHG